MRFARPLLLAIPAVLLLLAAAGAFAPDAVDDLAHVPAYVDWLLPVSRVLRNLLGALVVGAVVVGSLLAKPQSRPVLNRAGFGAVAWALSVLLMSLLTLTEALGLPLREAISPVVLRSFYTQTALGQVFVVQMVAAVLVSLLAPAVLGRATAWIVTVIALVGFCAPAFVGHGGLDGGHVAATISLALHIAAVGIWVGGLVAVCQLAFCDTDTFWAVLPRFSVLALVCVLVVAETGLLNASLRVNSPGGFLSSWYGALVLAKAVLLAWLVLLGWRQRKALSGSARETVLRLAGWELLVMAVAVAASVVLARVGPPAAVSVTDAVLPLSAALLALAVPGLVHMAWPRNVRVYPEIAAVILIVVLAMAVDVAVFAVVPAGSIPAALALVGVGWLFVASLPDDPSGRRVGVGLLMVAWPVVVWFGPVASSLAMGVDVLVGEAIAVWLLVRPVGWAASAHTWEEEHVVVS